MMHPAQIQATATAVPRGSLAYSFAEALCFTKGIPPEAFSPAAPGLTNWQAEIYRVLLETGLEIAVRNGN